MKQRVMTGILLVALLGAVVYLGDWWLRGAILCLMAVSMHEMYAAFAKKGMKPVRAGLALPVLLLLSLLLAPAERMMEGALASMALLGAVGIGAIVLRGHVDYDGAASSVLPLLYPGLFYVLMLDLTLGNEGMEQRILFALLFLVPSMNDCFALFAGTALGKRKLAPEISPKKTVEGSIGGLVAAVLFAVAIPYLIGAMYGVEATALEPVWKYALFGLAAGALSQIGDLAASLFKRHCGIKDFGRIFPGHGGVLDRLDGVLFASLAAHAFFRLMG